SRRLPPLPTRGRRGPAHHRGGDPRPPAGGGRGARRGRRRIAGRAGRGLADAGTARHCAGLAGRARCLAGRRDTRVTRLFRATGLEVHFPIRGGLLDAMAGRSQGVIRAVDGIDLTLTKGEVLALVGESGSGKTTTGRVIVKLTRQTGGTLEFDGKDVTSQWGTRALRDYRRRVQIIFQDPYETLNPKQTVRDFVAEPLVVNGIGTAAGRKTRVAEA